VRSETVAGLWRAAKAWAAGLAAQGVAAGTPVLICAENCVEWLAADAALALLGAISVPIDATAPQRDVDWIVRDAGARYAIVAGPFELERLLAAAARPGAPALHRAVVLAPEQVLARPDRRGRRRLSLSELVGPRDPRVLDREALLRGVDEAARERAAATRPGEQGADAPATLLYTAGTTGRARGVLLSHRALCFQVGALAAALELRPHDRVLLGLRLAFSFARVVAWVGVAAGVELAMPSRRLPRLRELATLQPTIVPAVPRQLEVLAAELRGVIHGRSLLRDRAARWAVGVGLEASQVDQQGGDPGPLLALRRQLAGLVVHRRVAAALGGRVRLVISGGAPLASTVAEWLQAVGVELVEGYGLTETSACATLGRPGAQKSGTVGLALPGVEVAVLDDGEIVVRGPNLALGTLAPRADSPPEGEDTAATATEAPVEGAPALLARLDRGAIDADGWWHTGDVGQLDPDGYLRVIDRTSDLLRTAAGKTVAPRPVERHLEGEPLIAAALVCGDGRPYLTALLVLDEAELRRWIAARGLDWGGYAEASQHAELYRHVERLVEARNRSLPNFETIRKFAVLDRQLTVEDGDLTPTLELRRHAVARKYARLIASFYETDF
jgi:long-chain acyl-CoA synthetase